MINETKTLFFEKIKRAWINKIRTGKKSYNWHHRNTKNCKRLLQATICNKMDNLEEMDKFLESNNLSKLNQKEIEHMNRPITITEIETVILKFPTKVKYQIHRWILSNI